MQEKYIKKYKRYMSIAISLNIILLITAFIPAIICNKIGILTWITIGLISLGIFLIAQKCLYLYYEQFGDEDIKEWLNRHSKK